MKLIKLKFELVQKYSALQDHITEHMYYTCP